MKSVSQNRKNVKSICGFKIYSSGIYSGNYTDLVSKPNSGTEAQTITRPITKTPSLYKVILINDDYTPMEFVILVLQKFFKKAGVEAEVIMLQVHQQGSGVAGVFTFEIAETKVYQVNQYSKANRYPLKCTLEEA